MKKWILKAIVQKTISFLPYKHQINHLFQKYITKGVNLSDEYFNDRLSHFGQHIAYYRKHRGHLEGIVSLELGTGWYPVIPIGLFLMGVEKVVTVDISELTNVQKIQTTIARFLVAEKNGNLQGFIKNFPLFKKRMAILIALSKQPDINLKELLEKLHITYLVEDARQLSLVDNSVHLITSNNTFEHVYRDVLSAILMDFQRVLHPKGLMSHFIDMSDHFAHLDKTITIYNFLQFSKKEWDRIDNSIQPQNRWRMKDFRFLYQQLNIPIIAEDHRPGDITALQTVKVHEEFLPLSEKELAISHGYLVSDKG